MHVFYALVADKKDKNKTINYLYDLCNRGEFDYFDEDTLKVFSGKEAKEMTDIYPILGRIPPLLSEAKVGDECRLFFTETIDNQ